MGAKEFDYYMFIDYSENYLGYSIIENKEIKRIIVKISKFKHYKEINNKPSYLKSIKILIDKQNIKSFFCKLKIRKVNETPEIYSDILGFLNEHANCLIFISVDNKQYLNFQKIVKIIDGENIKVVKESELKKDSFEYRLSLVLDTMLNLVRLKDEKF